jgi:hypothetical protein
MQSGLRKETEPQSNDLVIVGCQDADHERTNYSFSIFMLKRYYGRPWGWRGYALPQLAWLRLPRLARGAHFRLPRWLPPLIST